jgi:cell division protein FtsL
MLKLLICLVAVTAVAVCLVQLRQQRLDLAHESSELHTAIEGRQAKLWDQQVRLAAVTAPPAINRSADSQHLNLIPVKPTGVAATGWVDARE